MLLYTPLLTLYLPPQTANNTTFDVSCCLQNGRRNSQNSSPCTARQVKPETTVGHVCQRLAAYWKSAHGKVSGLVADHVMVSQILRCHAKLIPNKATARRFGPHEMHLHMLLLLDCLPEH